MKLQEENESVWNSVTLVQISITENPPRLPCQHHHQEPPTFCTGSCSCRSHRTQPHARNKCHPSAGPPSRSGNTDLILPAALTQLWLIHITHKRLWAPTQLGNRSVCVEAKHRMNKHLLLQVSDSAGPLAAPENTSQLLRNGSSEGK